MDVNFIVLKPQVINLDTVDESHFSGNLLVITINCVENFINHSLFRLSNHFVQPPTCLKNCGIRKRNYLSHSYFFEKFNRLNCWRQGDLFLEKSDYSDFVRFTFITKGV